MPKDYSHYEPLSPEEGNKLYFKVEALEELVSEIIDILQEHIKDIGLCELLSESFANYKKTI